MYMLNCYVLDWKWGECVGVFTDHYWTSQAVQTPDEWRGKTLSLWSLQITNLLRTTSEKEIFIKVMNAFGNSKKKNLNVSQYKKIIWLKFLQNLSLLKSLLNRKFVLKNLHAMIKSSVCLK